jgi:hypothetical protein
LRQAARWQSSDFFVGEAANSKKAKAGREKILDLWLGKTRSVTGLDGILSQDDLKGISIQMAEDWPDKQELSARPTVTIETEPPARIQRFFWKSHAQAYGRLALSDMPETAAR